MEIGIILLGTIGWITTGTLIVLGIELLADKPPEDDSSILGLMIMVWPILVFWGLLVLLGKMSKGIFNWLTPKWRE